MLEISTGHVPKADSEYFFRVRFDLTEKTEWYPAGMPIAWDEIALPWGKRTPAVPAASSAHESFSESGNVIALKAMPLLGSGKTDYQTLNRLAREQVKP